jgi:hypothetical protein
MQQKSFSFIFKSSFVSSVCQEPYDATPSPTSTAAATAAAATSTTSTTSAIAAVKTLRLPPLPQIQEHPCITILVIR